MEQDGSGLGFVPDWELDDFCTQEELLWNLLSHSEVDSILELLLRLSADGVAVIMIEHIMRAVTSFSERLR